MFSDQTRIFNFVARQLHNKKPLDPNHLSRRPRLISTKLNSVFTRPLADLQAWSQQSDQKTQIRGLWAAIPNGILKPYDAPRTSDVATLFSIDADGDVKKGADYPNTAKVIETYPRRSG
ncbi:hypothetical protein [Pelagimonas varians]|uniref:hypothetical protein n=1 Tax=Pelagimonas varians TaxID=696760 RepID=UPI0011447520|nr:hypothetical protein [Pelagimonas varians]